MITPEIAFKTLSQFMYPWEIASFLEEAGIVGNRVDAHTCVISNYFKSVTGRDDIVTTQGVVAAENSEGDTIEIIGNNTPAMAEFVRNFDNKRYPALVDNT